MTGLIDLSPFWLSFFSPKVTSISSLPLLFSIQLCESLWVFQAVENTWGIYYWLDLSLSFWLPLSLPGHLYLLTSSLLLYVTPWTSLSVPDCGDHLGNWLLARFRSPFLIPSLLLLVTSISLLPLLFSMWLREPFCVSPIVENFSPLT